MTALLMMFKREFWENQTLMVGLPAAFAALTLVSAIGVEVLAYQVSQSDFAGDIAEMVENDPDMSANALRDLRADVIQPMHLMSKFIGVGWLAGFIYLFSSLLTDRRDKSILFFKSLPVSERDTVLVKLAFASIVAPAIAILVGWVLAIFLTVFDLGTVLVGDLTLGVFVEFITAPIQAVVVGVLWGAPVFAYVALASATAKRHAFLLALIPLLGLAILESIIFDSRPIFAFFISHMPSSALDKLGEGGMSALLVGEFWSFALGVLTAIGFIAATVWMRNHRYEL